MFLSIGWLRDYCQPNISTPELAARLSLSGSHAESVESLKDKVHGVRVAKITAIRPHPNADRLQVCEIDYGDAEDVIVTAAKNMAAGDVVGVATPGAVLADGTVIEPHDFRGILSNGMFVSFEEIGFDREVISKEDGEGILILPEDTPIGGDLIDVLGIQDGRIEFEITPNRSDCLSVYGMALETSATLGIPFTPPQLTDDHAHVEVPRRTGVFDVRVETEGCNAYVAGFIRDLPEQKTPLWMKLRLMESGIRPVLFPVDITNYVMLETGLPLHAFDADRLKGEVRVVASKGGETLTLLDGTEVLTEAGDLLITAGGEPVALAGIMGLSDVAIQPDTRNIFLESAHFHRAQIKRTAARLKLSTEAASRFSKPLDPQLANVACHRALDLFSSAGARSTEKRIVRMPVEKPVTITASVKAINHLLGTHISVMDMKALLERIQCGVVAEGDQLSVTVPGHRPDLAIPADLAEEVGRLYGFSNIAPEPIRTELTVGRRSECKQLRESLRRFLSGMGWSEVLTYSFVGPGLLQRSAYDSERGLALENPLGEEFSVMRPSMVPHFLEIAEKNIHHKIPALRIFEMAHVFREGALDQETTVLTLLGYGEATYTECLRTVESILLFAGLPLQNLTIKRASHPAFHPGRSATIELGETTIARLGELHPEVAERFGLPATMIMEISVDALLENRSNEHMYVPIGRFPDVRREFSFVVHRDILFGEIRDALLKADIPFLSDVEFLDDYRDASLGDQRSLSLCVTLRREDATFTEEDIRKATEAVLSTMETSFSAKLRS